MIFDCHVHVENGLQGYDLPRTTRRNIIFNYTDHYRKLRDRVTPDDVISLILPLNSEHAFVKAEADAGRIAGLKIHSRIQQITSERHRDLHQALRAMPEHLPIIYDAFYFGPRLEHQPSLEGVISLAENFPERRFVIAHAGGYEVLKYFLHLRPLSNIWYDLSLSLQYLEDTSHRADLVKLVRYTDKSRIMYGSDYHYASPFQQAKVLGRICDEAGVSADDQKRIFFENAADLWNHPC